VGNPVMDLVVAIRIHMTNCMLRACLSAPFQRSTRLLRPALRNETLPRFSSWRPPDSLPVSQHQGTDHFEMLPQVLLFLFGCFFQLVTADTLFGLLQPHGLIRTSNSRVYGRQTPAPMPNVPAQCKSDCDPVLAIVNQVSAIIVLLVLDL
jgi:hypothetical protein